MRLKLTLWVTLWACRVNFYIFHTSIAKVVGAVSHEVQNQKSWLLYTTQKRFSCSNHRANLCLMQSIPVNILLKEDLGLILQILCIVWAMDLQCWSQKSKSFSNYLSVWFISSDQLWPNSKFSPLSDFTSPSSLALALPSCSTHDCAMLCKDAEASNQSYLHIYLCDQVIINFFVLMYALITKRQ